MANNAGFDCRIDRHGCYTDYTLTKGNRVLRIEYTAPRKNLHSGYLFMANGPINHNIEDANNFELPYVPYVFCGKAYALAKGQNWYYLTIEQIESLIALN